MRGNRPGGLPMAALVLAGAMVLAGCLAAPADNEASSRLSGADGPVAAFDPHADPVRAESGVTVEQQGQRYKAQRTVTVENGVGEDTGRLVVLQSTTNGGMAVHSRSQGGYVLRAELWAYGDTESQARENLGRMDVHHDDRLDDRTLRLDTRVVAKQQALPVQLPDVGNDRGGRLTLTVPHGLESQVAQSGVNGGAAIGGLRGPSATVSMTNGGIIVEGAFDDLDLDCTNGGISIRADRWSEGPGTWDGSCTNGGIDVEVVAGEDRGFDVQADITNGGIDIDLPGVKDVGPQSDNRRHVRTADYDDRAYRTAIDLDGTNGGISVEA